MNGAPPFRIDLATPIAWRATVAVLCGAAVAAVVAWLAAQEAPGAGLVIGTGVLLAVAVAGAATLTRATPARLRFDGDGYWLEATSGGPPVAGRIRVAVDVGGLLLLRFRPEASRRSRWLALARGQHPDAWHALRCAVYSPRSGQAPPAAVPPTE